MGLWQRRKRWTDLVSGLPWHTRSHGVSGLEVLTRSLNRREDEHLSDAQWELTTDHEKILALPVGRIVFEDEKEGRTHRHVIWSQIDADRYDGPARIPHLRGTSNTAREIEAEIPGRLSLQPAINYKNLDLKQYYK